MNDDYSGIKNQILQSAETVSEDFKFDSFLRIYLIGIGDYFRSHAIQIAQKIANFYDVAGVIIGSREPSHAAIVRRLIADVDSRTDVIFYGDFLEKIDSIKEPCLIIDFNATLGGRLYAQHLAKSNILIIDAQQALYHAGGSNVYLSLREERKYILENLDSYFDIMPLFTDEYSRSVLVARLMSYAALDRKYLLDVYTPNVRFSPFSTSNYSLCLTKNEVFVDAGAAYGDTVLEFYQTSRGNYKSIHAFEPDSHNFSRLSTTCQLMSNATAHFSGLGDTPGEISFFEDELNRFGSNFLSQGVNSKTAPRVPIVTIDDLVPDATLIKIDVEGFERKVILGARDVIKENKPKMHISSYHYPQDIPELMTTIFDLCNYKSVALRHYSSSLYDSDLLFSDEQSFGD